MKKFMFIAVILFAGFNMMGQTDAKPAKKGVKVTFIELGSVRCIPCKKMQKVMASVEKKYPKQVEVIFYDVWTKEQKHFADDYDIDLIPTQVFLDSNGKEYFRHEGYFPEEDLLKILKKGGVK